MSKRKAPSSSTTFGTVVNRKAHADLATRLASLERQALTIHSMLSQLRLGRTSSTWSDVLGQFTVLNSELTALANENKDFFRFNVLFPQQLNLKNENPKTNNASASTNQNHVQQELEKLAQLSMYVPDILSTIPPIERERDFQNQVKESYHLTKMNSSRSGDLARKSSTTSEPKATGQAGLTQDQSRETSFAQLFEGLNSHNAFCDIALECFVKLQGSTTNALAAMKQQSDQALIAGHYPSKRYVERSLRDLIRESKSVSAKEKESDDSLTAGLTRSRKRTKILREGFSRDQRKKIKDLHTEIASDMLSALNDIIQEILSFLPGNDCVRGILATNKIFRSFIKSRQSQHLYKRWLLQEYPCLGFGSTQANGETWDQTYKRLSYRSKRKLFRWQDLSSCETQQESGDTNNNNNNQISPVSRQGSAGTTLPDGSFAIFGGWTTRGMSRSLQILQFNRKKTPCFQWQPPRAPLGHNRFRSIPYGHTLTACLGFKVDRSKCDFQTWYPPSSSLFTKTNVVLLLVIGGVTRGGYRGAIGRTWFILLPYDDDDVDRDTSDLVHNDTTSDFAMDDKEKTKINSKPQRKRSKVDNNSSSSSSRNVLNNSSKYGDPFLWLNKNTSMGELQSNLESRAYHSATWVGRGKSTNGRIDGMLDFSNVHPSNTNHVFVFGGFCDDEAQEDGSDVIKHRGLQCLNVEKWQSSSGSESWKSPSVQAIGIPPMTNRFGHSATLVGPGSKFLCIAGGSTGSSNFKGLIDGEELINDIHLLDLSKPQGQCVWTKIRPSTPTPSGALQRCHSGVRYFGSSPFEILFFGGGVPGETIDDVHILNVETGKWSSPLLRKAKNSGGPFKPEKRQNHSAGLVGDGNGGKMVIFGGALAVTRNQEELGDTCILDIDYSYNENEILTDQEIKSLDVNEVRANASNAEMDSERTRMESLMRQREMLFYMFGGGGRDNATNILAQLIRASVENGDNEDNEEEEII
eukprot:g2156.t1